MTVRLLSVDLDQYLTAVRDEIRDHGWYPRESPHSTAKSALQRTELGVSVIDRGWVDRVREFWRTADGDKLTRDQTKWPLIARLRDLAHHQQVLHQHCVQAALMAHWYSQWIPEWVGIGGTISCQAVVSQVVVKNNRIGSKYPRRQLAFAQVPNGPRVAWTHSWPNMWVSVGNTVLLKGQVCRVKIWPGDRKPLVTVWLQLGPHPRVVDPRFSQC